MMHKVKQQLQPEREGRGWQVSVAEARQALLDDMDGSPSLRLHLQEKIKRT